MPCGATRIATTGVVPWVVRWHEERDMPTHAVMADSRLRYVDERPDDRDAFGMLWQRTGGTRVGSPDFGGLHPRRHRSAMDELLCQVCGLSAVGLDGRSWWLQPTEYLQPARGLNAGLHGDAIWTTHAPVCVACQPVARASCPHLQATPWVTLTVGAVEAVGFIGGVYDGRNGVTTGFVALADPSARCGVASQRVVGLCDFEEIEE